MPLNQSNQITLQEIHTRTELWKDHIYYISNNPYWNKDYQFLPLLQRFAEILKEFREAVDKQKASERSEEEREVAQQTISQIYQQIKEIIQQAITDEEEEPLMIEYEPGIEEADNQSEQEWIKEQQKKKQAKIKQLKLGLQKKNISQFQRFNQEHLKNWEIENLLAEWTELKKIVDDRI